MALLMVASAVYPGVKWLKVPYSIALVMVGLTMGACYLVPPVAMTPELILLACCLPAMLFEASRRLDPHEILRDWLRIFLLAAPGVVIVTDASSLILHNFVGTRWGLVLSQSRMHLLKICKDAHLQLRLMHDAEREEVNLLELEIDG